VNLEQRRSLLPRLAAVSARETHGSGQGRGTRHGCLRARNRHSQPVTTENVAPLIGRIFPGTESVAERTPSLAMFHEEHCSNFHEQRSGRQRFFSGRVS
jgi:hypothetical protein